MGVPHLRFHDRTYLVWTFFVSQAEKCYRTSHVRYPHATGRAKDRVWVSKRVSALEALYPVTVEDEEKSLGDGTWTKNGKV